MSLNRRTELLRQHMQGTLNDQEIAELQELQRKWGNQQREIQRDRQKLYVGKADKTA